MPCRVSLRRAERAFAAQAVAARKCVGGWVDAGALAAGEKALCSGELPDKSEIRRKVESVTIEDIQQVAQKIFRTGNLNLSLIGPVPEKMQREITKNLVIEGA